MCNRPPLLAGLVVTVLALVCCVGCGAAKPGPEVVQVSSLFPQIAGPRVGGALLVDPDHGRVGSLHFGMTIGQAAAMLPAAQRLAGHPGRWDAWYCGELFDSNNCGGAEVDLAAVPLRPFYRNPRLDEIYLQAATDVNGAATGGTNEVVTTKGVRLGGPAAAVRRAYTIAFTAPGCLSNPVGSGATYYARAGANLIGFGVGGHGVVQWIAIIQGQDERIC